MSSKQVPQPSAFGTEGACCLHSLPLVLALPELLRQISPPSLHSGKEMLTSTAIKLLKHEVLTSTTLHCAKPEACLVAWGHACTQAFARPSKSTWSRTATRDALLLLLLLHSLRLAKAYLSQHTSQMPSLGLQGVAAKLLIKANS